MDLFMDLMSLCLHSVLQHFVPPDTYALSSSTPCHLSKGCFLLQLSDTFDSIIQAVCYNSPTGRPYIHESVDFGRIIAEVETSGQKQQVLPSSYTTVVNRDVFCLH